MLPDLAFMPGHGIQPGRSLRSRGCVNGTEVGSDKGYPLKPHSMIHESVPAGATRCSICTLFRKSFSYRGAS